MTSTIPTANGSRPATTASPVQKSSALQLLRRPETEVPAIQEVERPASPQLPNIPATASAEASGLLSREQAAALAAPLNRANVQTRSQAGRSLNYLEGWVAIREANRIFGFDGWQRETIELRCVAESLRPIGRDQKPGWGVTYIARVRIRLGSQANGALSVVREGSGAGHGIDVDLGLAHESALKEAETDAMKRALMTFGNPFGLALYDKQQRQVTSSVREERGSQGQGPLVQPGHPKPIPEVRAIRPQVQADTLAISPAETGAVGLAALAPEVIQQLHAQVRGLPQPQLEAMVTAFRQRFRLAEGASVAAAITQKQHHDWVEAYLVQVEGKVDV
ncbi:MAG: RAD52 family DNA repair protein [Cyanobacteria bacterium]|nr:RAD52 family DNA repair protein [Cyanobacteriota bacterium]